MTYDYLIVGAGIWGLGTALHIAWLEPNATIAVVDQSAAFAEETTRQSAGQVGAFRQDPLLTRAVQYTFILIDRINNEFGQSTGWVQSGSVHVALTRQRSQHFMEVLNAARALGVEAENISLDELRQRVPKINTAVVQSALWIPRDGYLCTRTTCRAIHNLLQQHRCSFAFNHKVDSILVDGERVTGVRTSQGDVTAGRTLLCAGPFAGKLLKPLGFTVPSYPIRLQQGRTVRCGVKETHPVLRAPDLSCYLRPEEGGYLYGCFHEEPLAIDLNQRSDDFRTRDLACDEALMADIQSRLAELMPDLRSLPIDQYRQGMISSSPDGKFVVGAVPRWNGLYLATGCGGTGIAAFGAATKTLAEQAVKQQAPGKAWTDWSEAWRPDRYGELGPDVNWLVKAAMKTAASYYKLPDTAV